jgi:hypothetical protein
MTILKRNLLAAALLATGLALPAFAQGSGVGEPDATQNGRYTMTPAPNGFLRMDTRSGAVALCTLRDGNVTCASSADERGALEAEIARLSKENAALRERLAEVTQRGPAARMRDALPNEDEMNKALGMAETFMRRMMRIMREEAPKGDKL